MKDIEADAFTRMLENFSKALTDDKVEWIAISMKYKSGGRIAVHSRDAPARPSGMSTSKPSFGPGI